jgi:hypothetical protein
MPHELLTLLVRRMHILAMAGMLGGAMLVWAMSVRAAGPDLAQPGGLLPALAEKYERLFWLAMGVQVMTGAGNLGAFGAALPAPATVWGGRFALKLLAVLIFLAFSLLRTLVLARLTQAGGLRSARAPRVLQSFYGGTALALAAIALLASLNTLLGLGLFGVLWFLTWWSTRRAARGIEWTALEHPSMLARRLGRVALWGGINGTLFFAVLLSLIVANAAAAIVQGRASAGDFVPVIALEGGVGSAAAFIIGVVVALLFLLIDGTLARLARWLVPEI